MRPVPMFVELCAGTAAVSLRLARAKARPPVARIGCKAGYADAILDLAGLSPGQGAASFVWAEPDPVARRLLEVVADPQRLAALVRGCSALADEDPRDLFEHLDGAADVEAFLRSRWAYRGVPSTGFSDSAVKRRPKTATDHGSRGRDAGVEAAFLLRYVPSVPARIAASAFDVAPCAGAVVYIDPPYEGTTGYGHPLPRDEAVALARAWDAAGALVMVSEAEPIAALGWPSVDITGRRSGQARTFSRQQREIVTMNRPSLPHQVGLDC